ncbi:PEP-CTERM/exosortase A-associated glycosyltransferase, Daro_2409 family [Nitrosomonas cryotolerans]|uniref:PEP-CTERM/exosortase A-associated glycosyltransferase, Daro_2409 family n=1 Tax=Nitrosomonas cryotolerans ATCC 49181 TaxID=1131553 RepID=A0A1N6HYH6_9PROT|nr:TIGR04063 family PEP-CTERM/XrtA system glycosyltransferase [Nitrosomonas cryotolerans]SFP68655.1 PEP-CTERM/exosortase A-associated glycosyltransferase, Daro_2409 family [Nitrosomonas cryotolerans]SIO24853.1 PEP-CTERM/exosortase A-associated glycosyltransferase, Daro_2409 family [Nitrosomonas cryotolerans ATCC 49181]
MRILHILDHSIPLHSGYTFRTLSILRAQHLLGWETFHITSIKQGSNQIDEEYIDDWHFYRTPTVGSFAAKLPVLKQLIVIDSLTRRLRQVVETVKPDVLHAHSPALNAIAALRVGRHLGIPVIYEIRAFWEDAAVDHGTNREWGLRYRFTRWLESYAVRRVNAVTTICEGLRNDIVKRGISSDKVTVIPNAVDIDKFSVGGVADTTFKNQLGLKDKRLIGFIGSFYAYEGLDILLRALPLMIARIPELCILLTGGGPQDEKLRQLAKDLGIQDKVVFTGRIPHEQVQKYYDLLEVLVYPRLSMRLTDLVTPLKPLEAMAQGRLLAASDVGGHLELIRDGETGLLFKAGDPQSLADKVCDLLSSPEQWPALRQAGRHFVETERNWLVSVSRYKAVYESLVTNRER